jgi:hypothetical protein
MFDINSFFVEVYYSYFQNANVEVVKKLTGEPRFPGLTLKTLLNWDLYWNKCTLYIKIEALLKHYYMYSILCIEITQSV